MNTFFVILILWCIFVLGVYAHFYYEVKARFINFNDKINKLRDTLTEEE